MHWNKRALLASFVAVFAVKQKHKKLSYLYGEKKSFHSSCWNSWRVIFLFLLLQNLFLLSRTSNLYGKSIDFDTKYGNIIQGSILIREGDTKHDYIHFPMRLPYHFFVLMKMGFSFISRNQNPILWPTNFVFIPTPVLNSWFHLFFGRKNYRSNDNLITNE